MKLQSKVASLALLLIGTLILTVLSLSDVKADAQFEEWVPYVPYTSQVVLDYRRENGISYLDILIEFPSTGFNISDWGTPTVIGRNISVNALIWRWTGYDFPIVITVDYTYNLGKLSPGEYGFTFNVWGFPVQNITFNVFIMVPDDYPTIQKAINSANEGDTVFVKNGTYYENVVVNKTISLIGENRSTTFIDGNRTGTVLNMNTSNAVINGFSIVKCDLYSALVTVYGCDNRFHNNVVFNDGEGMGILLRTNNSVIENNTFEKNTYFTIRGEGSSKNFIQNNILTNNSGNWGIHLDDSSNNNKILNNTIRDSGHSGICIGSSAGNIISYNVVSSGWWGVYLGQACNNTICNNNLFDNAYADIYLRTNSNYNIIYHNNLNHARIDNSFNNTLDNGCEGNYWSDYNGTDTSTPPDGIGDTPYIIDENNTDRYPLMNPYWNPTDINHDLKVDIKDLATAAIAFGSYPDHPKWNPHTDITGPDYLVPDDKVDIRDLALIAVNFGEIFA